MKEEYYPWGGEFTTCLEHGSIAVVLLNINYIPPKNVAIYGSLKTENIGIEKIVANLISNPNIRYLFVCGNDIKGHRCGMSIIALNKNGIDDNNRIIDAPGAIPYIANLNKDAIKRFRNQIEIINLIGITNKDKIDKTIKIYSEKSPKPYGNPYYAIKIKNIKTLSIDDKRALHSKIVIDYLGRIKRRDK
jgi:tetrahydromethanopterin S-methyltransferase subunit A